MKNLLLTLLVSTIACSSFAYDWELYSPPGIVIVNVHFFESDLGSAVFSYHNFYISENLVDPDWQFIDVPADGAASFNADTILIIISEGSYSDGVYFLDVNTHEYSVLEYCYRPNFILKEMGEDHYYVGFEDGLLESVGGLSWNEVLEFKGVECLDMAKGDPNVFALACDFSEHNVFMSYDDGNTWEQRMFPAQFFEIAFHGYYGMLNNLVGVCNGVDGGLYELNGATWELLYFSLAIQALGLDNSQSPYLGWYTGMPPDIGIARYKMNPPGAGIMYFNDGLPNTNIMSISESPPIFGSNWVFCCTDEGAFVCKGIGVGQHESTMDVNTPWLYPNPVESKLYISMPLQEGDGSSIFLRDMNGKLILQKGIRTRECSVELLDLPTGVYIASIRNTSGLILHSQKIIKH